MRQLTATEIHAINVSELGFDPSLTDLLSEEAITSALLRAASFLCPCSTPTLVRSVIEPLRGLCDDFDIAQDLVKKTLESITAHGDLLEHREITADPPAIGNLLLYVAPASFVARESGSVILLGVSTEGETPLPLSIRSRIDFNHYRTYAFALI